MQLSNIIRLARKHVADTASNELSARCCLADAVSLSDDGDYEYARQRALKSLAYSLGILSPVYQRAAK